MAYTKGQGEPFGEKCQRNKSCGISETSDLEKQTLRDGLRISSTLDGQLQQQLHPWERWFKQRAVRNEKQLFITICTWRQCAFPSRGARAPVSG